jgi:antitoxin component of RelBE/YafQ-DinJ toxin-antitoxin module
MRQFNVRVPDDLYEQARVTAESKGITLSDFVRDAVSRVCRNGDASHDVIGLLRDEMRHKNEQIDHLQQLLAMQSKTTAALTDELSTSRQMIEDLRRHKPSWFKRTFRWT